METVKENWCIKELIDNKALIDPKPQYQRTTVWNLDRKAFLIDSILRGYDIPKFYFTYYEKKNSKGFTFEVADGQQRIRAIWEFYDDMYPLKKNTKINGIDLSSMKYSDLPDDFKIAFANYALNITNILTHTPGEVNDLFTRLQKGVSLNPPELRHAIVSNIGIHIEKFLIEQQTSGFFRVDAKIPDLRFKHQDYLDHVFALIHYRYTRDLKAATMAQLYVDFSEKEVITFADYFHKAKKVLKLMHEINAHNKGMFKNKWSFVDCFWLLYRHYEELTTLNPQKFAAIFIEFDSTRRMNNSRPEELLTKGHPFGKLLYDYIQAFNKEGALKEKIKTRADILDVIFKDFFIK